MKKLAYCLSLCLVMFVGVFAFAGCGATNELSSIKIKVMPTDLEYSVGETLDLSGGIFIAEYSNGTKHEFRMNNVDLAYINYGSDTQTTIQFTEPAQSQPIVIKYKGKSTTFNVSVIKGNMSVTYNKTYTKAYNGASQPIEELSDLALPTGASICSIEYRIAGNESESAYSTTAPTVAGNYDVRVKIIGGDNYNNLILDDISYTITKSDLTQITTNNYLNFPEIAMEYSDEIDLTNNWQIVANGEKGAITAGLPASQASVADNLKYYYRLASDADYTELTPDVSGKILLNNLKAGEYKVKVNGTWASNINDFEVETDLIIQTKKLVYGEDYTLTITQNDQPVVYTVSNSALNIATEIEYTAGDEIVVAVELINAKANSAKTSAPVVTFATGGSWEHTGIATINGVGAYKVIIDVEFEEGTFEFVEDQPFHGINVVSAE